MSVIDRVRGGITAEASAVLVVNLVPLVGVLVFGWNAATLVAIYWFELAVLSFWAVVRAVFAGRPSEFDSEMLIVGALADRTAAIPIPLTGVGIQLSTLPVIALLAPMLAVVWFVVGTLTVGVVGSQALEGDAIDAVTFAVFAIFLGEGGRTALEYFYRQGYREHSAQTAIHGVFWRGAVLFFVGLCCSVFAAVADPSVASDEPISDADPTIASALLLVGIVLAKFGFDLVGSYRDRLAAFGESIGVGLESTIEPPTHEAVDTSLADDHRRVRPSAGGRLLATTSHAKRHPTTLFVGMFPAVFALLFAIGGVWSGAVALVIVAVAVPLVLVHVDYWLRYVGVEYRVDDDAIVAYDRLFRTPLWRVEAWDESGVRVERDWLETSTVIVELPDSEHDRRLPGLCETGPVLEVFDRPPDGVDGD
ncbi:DUF6498-containing protein [Natrialba sp. INN-245]|uniref:DUF6498-containing protein n=1 Tax=Natrialba sp. INN-245 TaxID=2690967 RepID=UPI0013138DEF|nr:DUF6498-containing protein [Natrialba sp. INN-245]MWV41410.1 PH domain-containing protein [Natrialba sp. INN-245]